MYIKHRIHTHTYILWRKTLWRQFRTFFFTGYNRPEVRGKPHFCKTLRLKKEFGKQITVKARLTYGIPRGGIFGSCFIIKYKHCTMRLNPIFES